MTCPAILTGSNFLATTLAHIDCQGRTIGAYGYGALSDPGSTVTLVLTGLLTLFVALFGIRLMLSYPVRGGDVVGAALRVSLVLTLATSWPAWRVIGYDLVMDGPAEVARAIGGASALPGGDGGTVQRLQMVDDGLVAITTTGTGRISGDPTDNPAATADPWARFRGIAMTDDTGFGWGRVVFLAGVIGPYAITRLSAGILLALAPIMAGLLLFGGTVGVFVGWLRGLAFAALGALGLLLIEGVELAVLDPWVRDVLVQRGTTAVTPSVPTELLVLALAFCVAKGGMLLVIARVVFHAHGESGRLHIGQGSGRETRLREDGTRAIPVARTGAQTPAARVVSVADAVAATMRREAASDVASIAIRADASDAGLGGTDPLNRRTPAFTPELLGSSFRRTHRRASAAGERRDRKA